MTKINNPRTELSHLLDLASRDSKILDVLLDDLFTPEEINTVAQRWSVIRRVYRGVPQREIARDLGVGVATVTRGSHMLKNLKGGFNQIIHMILATKNPTGLTRSWRNELEK